MLSLLHARVESLTGCGKLQDMAVFLATQAAQPYLTTLQQWLTEGVIHDPYREVTKLCCTQASRCCLALFNILLNITGHLFFMFICLL